MFELQSNRLGEEKGNAQEKSFAAQTMKDHTKTSSELKLMVEPARSRCSDPRRSTARHDAEPRQGK
ncbi:MULTISPECIES: DUF4142 domain-containing protein [unclassified Bradyrhizobium]|jgi:putative membrane protein|uniref:DUF4142 domain-containing protein n=1 Tax=Bradyrhizobium TaxID=374 RepID=UPI00005DE02F